MPIDTWFAFWDQKSAMGRPFGSVEDNRQPRAPSEGFCPLILFLTLLGQIADHSWQDHKILMPIDTWFAFWDQNLATGRPFAGGKETTMMLPS